MVPHFHWWMVPSSTFPHLMWGFPSMVPPVIICSWWTFHSKPSGLAGVPFEETPMCWSSCWCFARHFFCLNMASVNPQGWPIISRLLTLDPALDSLSLSPSKVQNHPNITDRVIQKIQHSRHGSYGPKKLDWLLVEMWGIYIYIHR